MHVLLKSLQCLRITILLELTTSDQIRFVLFFSLIFGVNQYVVLHLFGIFNFLILSIGVSLLTHKLSQDFSSVVLSVSLFVFGLPLVDFISNHAENSKLHSKICDKKKSHIDFNYVNDIIKHFQNAE